MTKEIIIIADYHQQTELSLQELCEICSVSPELVHQLVAYEIIVPTISHPHQYHFDLAQFKRLQSALRLQRDLDMNLAGIAIVLDLLEDLEDLRQQTELLKKHLLR